MSIVSLNLGLIFAYLLGSIPTGFIVGKVFWGMDLRKVGSGNPGTTNVYRSIGLVPAIVVFSVDMSKGLLPVLFFTRIFFQEWVDNSSFILFYQILLPDLLYAGNRLVYSHYLHQPV